MKKKLYGVLACVFFIATPVLAEEIAWLANKGGGKIVLTNETCQINNKTYPNLYRSFMYTASGITANSCYYLDGSTIRMMYQDGTEMRYPVENFTVRDTPTKTSV